MARHSPEPASVKKGTCLQQELVLDNALWRFSNDVYHREGVASKCLALQNTRAVDVNLLLFACWVGAARRTLLETEDVDRATLEVADWNANVVRELRSVRNWLKTAGEITFAEVKALRGRILADELSAESVEQALLFRWFAQANIAPSTRAPRELVEANIRQLVDDVPELLVAAALAIAVQK